MSATGWALLLKPFIGLVILAGMYFLPRYIAMLLRPLIPRRWQGVLFEGWEHGSVTKRDAARPADSATSSDDRLLK